MASLLLIAGCGSERPSAPPTDAGPRDAFVPDGAFDAGRARDTGPRPDGSPDAAGLDGDLPDAFVDPLADAFVDPFADAFVDPLADAYVDPLADAYGLDASSGDGPRDSGFELPDVDPFRFDFGPRPDIGVTLPDGEVVPEDAGPPCSDRCPCPRPASECSGDGECGAGLRCVEAPCGERRCERGGAACGGDPDCAPGTPCVGGFCARPTPGCADARDCPLGYECETPAGASSGECVDRRVPCVEPTACPRGTICLLRFGLGAGMCVRVHRACASDAACMTDFAPNARCVDVDGDGDTECTLAGTCTTNAECALSSPGSVCGVFPTAEAANCTPFGPCRTVADCSDPGSFACTDISGTGQPECVRTGGCTSDAQCSPREMCATAVREDPPRCVAGDAQ